MLTPRTLASKFPVLLSGTDPTIIADIRDKPSMRRHKEELIRGAQAQQALIILEQERINAANARIQHRFVEGIGEKIAEFGAGWFWQEVEIRGGIENAWSDPEFINDCLKKHPECRIRYDLPASVRVDGFKK